MAWLRIGTLWILASILACYSAFAQVVVAPQLPLNLPADTGIYDPALNAKVEALLAKMTLEEKVGQTVQYSAGEATGPGTGRTDYHDMVAKGQIGALLNVTNARETNKYQKIAVEQSRLHIPVLFGLDVIHGFRTGFPVPLAMASTWNPDLVEQAARIAAQESSAAGIRWAFSPMVDISRDARWGRMVEGAGEDPYLDSLLAVAYVRGYQGKRLSSADSIAACAKHYVGYGAAEAGRDYNTTEISERTLHQYYLPGFLASVDAGVATIMSAFNAVNGVPASANSMTLKQILRRDWGFKGIADSDWDAVGQLRNHGIALDGTTAARKAFSAGVDMDMVSGFYHDHLADLVRAGEIPKADLDEAVRRILRLKFALGLFEHPYVDEAAEAAAMLHPESVNLAEQVAEQSIVLLKNAAGPGGSGLLPLSKDLRKIALIGPLADDPADMAGSWIAQIDTKDVVTLRAELSRTIGDTRFAYERGTGFTDGSDSELKSAVDLAAKSDVVLLALGERTHDMTGEAASRAHLDLPGQQEELLEKVVATGKPVVLILFSGRPLTLPWAMDHVASVLAAWTPGIQAGPALAKILFGDASPSGKLVVSWPRSVGQEPLYYNALSTGRPPRNVDLNKYPERHDEKYVSRYLDENNSPQFPFGFGLSYTTFQYGATSLSRSRVSASDLLPKLKSSEGVLTASADVTNTGARQGEEVVELYIRLEGTSVAQPVRALKAFTRVSLKPGESKNVAFHLPASTFALWDEQNKLTIEPAKVTVWISPDSSTGTGSGLEIGK